MYKKHPKTFHIKNSGSVHSDDKVLKNMKHFEGKEIVINIKKDGENTKFYRDYWHARSIDSKHNFTQDWIARLHSCIRFDIPEGYALTLENVSYYHSIFYQNLPSYAYLLFVTNEKNEALSFDETLTWAELLELPCPEILYRGIYDEKVIQNLIKTFPVEQEEGFFIRNAEAFSMDDFALNAAKYVRPNHIQPNHEGDITHWLKNTYPNQLANPQEVLPSCMRPIEHHFSF